MSDVTGRTEALWLLARVIDGRADELRGALAALGDDDRSPFARVPGTFLARFVILESPMRRGRAPEATYLLWAADVDAPATEWLRLVCRRAAERLDPVFACLSRCPGLDDPRAFAEWVQANRLPVGFSVVGSPQATVGAVRDALDARRRLRAFAADSHDGDPAALRAAWRALPWA